jgi:hypothetical protein
LLWLPTRFLPSAGSAGARTMRHLLQDPGVGNNKKIYTSVVILWGAVAGGRRGAEGRPDACDATN